MMVLFTNMDKVESISIATEGTVTGKAEVGKVTLKSQSKNLRSDLSGDFHLV